MVNKEIVKFIFDDSKKIKNSEFSLYFLKQIINAKTKNFKLNINNFNDLWIWENGIWYNGIWDSGMWKDGIWKKGIWKGGDIYNPKTKIYEPSKVPPNECEWSLSYDKT